LNELHKETLEYGIFQDFDEGESNFLDGQSTAPISSVGSPLANSS